MAAKFSSENASLHLKNTSLSSYTTSPDTRKDEDDGEIRVFGAEKYFNTRIDDGSPKQQCKREEEEETNTIQPSKPIPNKNHHPASSTRSESSHNSQRHLLRTKSKKSRARGFLRSLSCNCACSDKNSVDVAEEHVGEISFTKNTNYNVVHAKPVETKLMIDQKLQSKEICISVQNHPPKPKLQLDDVKNPRSPLQDEYEEHGCVNYESGSDASSDLFEIESLTNPFPSKSCYAPSEASIEWSVVTASAADFDEQRHGTVFSQSGVSTKTKMMAQRRRVNIMLSCKSHKAVRVAGDAYLASDNLKSDRVTQVTRFQAQNRMSGCDSRHPIARSRSPQLLFIQ